MWNDALGDEVLCGLLLPHPRIAWRRGASRVTLLLSYKYLLRGRGGVG